jgi:hypothetical protein
MCSTGIWGCRDNSAGHEAITECIETLMQQAYSSPAVGPICAHRFVTVSFINTLGPLGPSPACEMPYSRHLSRRSMRRPDRSFRGAVKHPGAC